MLEHTTLSAGRGYAVTVYAPDDATYKRLVMVIEGIVPAAFQPVPVSESVAVAVQRDVLPLDGKPPNCDGHSTAAVHPDDSTGRLPRANFPPYVTDDREDDEGDLAEPARYPPGVACSITGGCADD